MSGLISVLPALSGKIRSVVISLFATSLAGALPVVLLASFPAQAAAAACAKWVNPTVPPSVRAQGTRAAHPDQVKVPEGLTLLDASGAAPSSGSLHCDKPTVLFIHGWTRDGASSGFPHAGAWTGKFNVLLFRWHRLSYSPFVPFQAENRVPQAYERLAEETRKLLRALGDVDYRQEVRVVAMSLGAQLAIPLMSEFFPEGLTRARRLELLDPYLWVDNIGKDPQTGETFPSEQKEELRSLRSMGIRTAVYGTSVTRYLGRTLAEVSNYQAMHPRWLGGDVIARHEGVDEFYFGSMRFPPPRAEDAAGRVRKAFSASLPTAEFPPMRVALEQLPVHLDRALSREHAFKRVTWETCGDSVWKLNLCF